MDTCPPILSTNTSISENTSASFRTDGPRQEVASKNNSVSRLDEELLSVLDLQNDDSKEGFAIGNSIVRSEDLPTKATITDERRLAGSFCSKTVFNLSQRALSDIEIQILEKGWTFHEFRDPLMSQSFEKILKSLVLNGTFETKLRKIFLINLHFVLNLVGNLLLSSWFGVVFKSN